MRFHPKYRIAAYHFTIRTIFESQWKSSNVRTTIIILGNLRQQEERNSLFLNWFAFDQFLSLEWNEIPLFETIWQNDRRGMKRQNSWLSRIEAVHHRMLTFREHNHLCFILKWRAVNGGVYHFISKVVVCVYMCVYAPSLWTKTSHLYNCSWKPNNSRLLFRQWVWTRLGFGWVRGLDGGPGRMHVHLKWSDGVID